MSYNIFAERMTAQYELFQMAIIGKYMMTKNGKINASSIITFQASAISVGKTFIDAAKLLIDDYVDGLTPKLSGDAASDLAAIRSTIDTYISQAVSLGCVEQTLLSPDQPVATDSASIKRF